MIWTPNGIRNISMRRKIPSRVSTLRAEQLLKQAIRDSGMPPGRYRNPDEVEYSMLTFVQHRICEQLEHEIAQFDAFEMSSKLYALHEKLLDSDRLRVNSQAIGVQAIRSLIELTVKCCDSSGVSIDEETFDFLIALAQQAIAWDYVWDQFNTNLFEQDIVIEKDYAFKPQEITGAASLMRAYKGYLAARIRRQEIYEEEQIATPYPEFGRESLISSVESLGLKELDHCLRSTVRYGLVDHLEFVYALSNVALLDRVDIAGLDFETFKLECRQMYGLHFSTLDELAKDFSLSRQSIGQVDSTRIFSVERRNRDSRFMRRPLVLIENGRRTQLLFGLRTLWDATDFLIKQISFGRIPVDRWSEHAEVERAYGRIQSSKGAPLRDAIAKDCEKIVGRGRVVVEKDYVSGVKSDPNMGPVDVFVVDDVLQRFILVEIKNSASAGTEPLSMSDERRLFLEDFLPNLKAKADWFRTHVNELKREFRIPEESDYRFEEVIVVNQKRLWVLALRSQTPILDDDEFLQKLGAGRELLSDVVGIVG